MTWHPDMPDEYKNQIITGDARELAKRIPDESIDLILTDPPFGIGFKYNNGFVDSAEDYDLFLRWLISESNRIVRPDGYIFIFLAHSWTLSAWNIHPEARLFAACRNFVQMNRPIKPYGFGPAYSFDPVLYWSKTKSPTPTVGKDYFVGNTSNTRNRGINEAGWHSCPRPLDTIFYIMRNHSQPQYVVLDLFIGSGTTAVAAKLLGRNYIAFEINPETAELARERVRNTQPPLFVMEPEQLEMI